MLKACLFTLIFLCISFNSESYAETTTLNWCGTYFEENDQGFIRIPHTEFKTGSNSCSIEEYHQRVSSGSIAIALDFIKSRSALNNWRKFSNHVIVVRGKIRNGNITNTRFVRDIGI